MNLQFDANQQFRLDAIAAVTDLFEGQPHGAPEYAIIKLDEWGGLLAGQDRTELGVGNRLLLDEEKLRQNARAVQLHNDIDTVEPAAPLEAWESLIRAPVNPARARISRWRWRRAQARPTSTCVRSLSCPGAMASPSSPA